MCHVLCDEELQNVNLNDWVSKMRVPLVQSHDPGLVMCLTMSCLKIIYVSHSSCRSSSAKMAKSVFRNIRSATTGASARTTRTRKIAVSLFFPFYSRQQTSELSEVSEGFKIGLVIGQFGLLTHSFASNYRNPSDANLQPHRLVIKFIRS